MIGLRTDVKQADQIQPNKKRERSLFKTIPEFSERPYVLVILRALDTSDLHTFFCERINPAVNTVSR